MPVGWKAFAITKNGNGIRVETHSFNTNVEACAWIKSVPGEHIIVPQNMEHLIWERITNI